MIADDANNIVTNHLPMVHSLGEMQVALNRQDNAVYRYLNSKTPRWLDEFEKERLNYMRWFSQVEEGGAETMERDKLSEIDQLYVQYDNHARQILLAASHGKAPTKDILEKGGQYLTQIQGLVDEIVAFREGMTIVHRDRIQKTIRYHNKLTFIFLFSIGLFFAFLALYLWRFLVRPLSLLLNGIRDFTRGKTDVRIPPVGKDELGELQEAFNEMAHELNIERKRLRSESQSDSLTGLFNMRYFRLQLVEEFSRSQRYGHPLSLLMLDVDFFKAYNDRNGHPAGDIVLKEVSRILIRNVRGTDIVARYGGEEFVVLLPETPQESACGVAEKIRKSIEEHHFPFRETQAEKKVTASIGIGCYPDGKVTSDQDLIESADQALYAAKKGGRNQISLCFKGDIVKPRIAPK